MANSATFRPVAGVSHGEQNHQVLYIEGAIYFRVAANNEWVKLTLVDDGTDSGIYVFKADTQTADNVMPT